MFIFYLSPHSPHSAGAGDKLSARSAVHNLHLLSLNKRHYDARQFCYSTSHLIHVKVSGGYNKPVPSFPSHWDVLDPDGDLLSRGRAKCLCQPRPGQLLLTVDLEASPGLHRQPLGVVTHARVGPNLPGERNLGLGPEDAVLRPDDQAAIVPDYDVVSSDASLFEGIEN